MIHMDYFYKGLSEADKNDDTYNFDHPNALDFDSMYECLRELMNKSETEVPQYDFHMHKRKAEKMMVRPQNLIFFEGIFAFHDERI